MSICLMIGLCSMFHIYIHRDDPPPPVGNQVAANLHEPKPLKGDSTPTQKPNNVIVDEKIQLATYQAGKTQSRGRIVLVLGDTGQLGEDIVVQLGHDHGDQRSRVYSLQLVEAGSESYELGKPKATSERIVSRDSAPGSATTTQKCGLISMRAH